MPTVYSSVTGILQDQENLVPFISEAARMFATYRFAFAPRVLRLSDMRGWNLRKVSEWNPVGRASQLSEATDIPEKTMNVKHRYDITPSEWGDRYPITDRRIATAGANLIPDVITALGYSLGAQRERSLIAAVESASSGFSIGSGASAFSLDYIFQTQAVFKQRAVREQTFVAIHPYQLLDIKKDYLDLSNPSSRVFASQLEQGFVNNRDFTLFGNSNIVEAETLPRMVTYRVRFGDYTAGTFRLHVNGQNTASITFSTTLATLKTNVEAALNALTGESGWVLDITGADIDDLTIVAPTAANGEDELRVAFRPEDNSGSLHYWDLTGGTDLITPDEAIVERSATANALAWVRDAVLDDVRAPISTFMELVNQGRTLEVSQYETYGVGVWRDRRAILIASDASAPHAVGA